MIWELQLLLSGDFMERFVFPPEIRQALSKEEFQLDDPGYSGSQVLPFEDQVLKIEECSEETRHRAEINGCKGKFRFRFSRPISSQMAWTIC